MFESCLRNNTDAKRFQAVLHLFYCRKSDSNTHSAHTEEGNLIIKGMLFG